MPIIDVLPFRACYDCGRNETILTGALRAGRFLRYGCRHGGCGTCRVLLVDGEVEQAEFRESEGHDVKASVIRLSRPH